MPERLQVVVKWFFLKMPYWRIHTDSFGSKQFHIQLMCIVFQVAQYIHFATPILNAFLEKFKEEEERVVEKIKEK